MIPIGLISCYSLDHHKSFREDSSLTKSFIVLTNFSSRNHVDGHTCMHECRMKMARKLLQSFYLLLKNFLCNRGSLRSFRNDKTMLGTTITKEYLIGISRLVFSTCCFLTVTSSPPTGDIASSSASFLTVHSASSRRERKSAFQWSELFSSRFLQ